MGVTIYKKDGTPLAGDPKMSDAMEEMAIREGGYVTDDDSGKVLYDARTEA